MRNRTPGGFTLIEVMVAVTITALLLMTIYGVFTSVSRGKARIEADAQGFHQARVIFDRIGREIRGAYFPAGSTTGLFSGGESAGGIPFLELSTTATTPQGGRRGGIAAVRYELRDDPEGEKGQKVLLRNEYPLFDPDGARAQGYRMATGIEALKFRFFDGSWKEQWPGGGTGTPLSVEVSLSVRVGEELIPFRSSFEVSRLQ